MEHNGAANVNDGDYGQRIFSLEGRMTTVEISVANAATLAATAAANAKTAADNSAEILLFLNATKGAIGFIRKHGPKLLSFGAGIMTVAGIGNPAVLHFISHFSW